VKKTIESSCVPKPTSTPTPITPSPITPSPNTPSPSPSPSPTPTPLPNNTQDGSNSQTGVKVGESTWYWYLIGAIILLIVGTLIILFVFRNKISFMRNLFPNRYGSSIEMVEQYVMVNTRGF
jgi:hypothetical protein